MMLLPFLKFALKVDTIPKVDIDNQQVVNAFNAVLMVAGIVAVVFIIISAIQYIISIGDAAKIKKAKDGIMYSVVGLVIVGISFMVVQLVVGIF